LTAYLATGSVKFRDRAERVWERLEAAFYDPAARAYRSVALRHDAKLTFTPRRFGLLQAALATRMSSSRPSPVKKSLRTTIEDRVGRLNTLGLEWLGRSEPRWRDRLARRMWRKLGTGPDGKPLGLGGLQMAERTLSGETGSYPDPLPDGGRAVATDREHDCVPEISAVGLPSSLANSVTLHTDAVARDEPPGLRRRRRSMIRLLPAVVLATTVGRMWPGPICTADLTTSGNCTPRRWPSTPGARACSSCTRTPIRSASSMPPPSGSCTRPGLPATGIDANGRYDPAVLPRALALNSTATVLYVTGQRSGRLYALDAATGNIRSDAAVCSEPVGVLVDASDKRIFVACSGGRRSRRGRRARSLDRGRVSSALVARGRSPGPRTG